ncbi:uncharacterized protein LOC135478092 [Liolophura sinensis]|uniref:uncharacterized protein LOC135478092 n=1 Tax=Liolophura sinensis TaxID=3198878 RepID=UPI003158E824
MEQTLGGPQSYRDPCWQGKTPYWKGSGYYVPSERGWQMYHEYRDVPPKDRINAILFEKQAFFRSVIQQLGDDKAPGGVLFKNPAHGRLSTPHEKLILQKPGGWDHVWTGAGLYMQQNDTWINDQSGANVPAEALLFINEEDWIKFKHAHNNPSYNIMLKTKSNMCSLVIHISIICTCT